MTSVQRNKKFKIIFNNDIEIDYRVHNTELAEKWFAKIKHLKRVPFDTIESGTEDVSDLRGIYKEFCNFAGIEYEPFDNINQKICNKLHKLYEDQHEKLSRLPISH